MKGTKLKRRLEDLDFALTRINVSKLKNKSKFNERHRLRPKRIEEEQENGTTTSAIKSNFDERHRLQLKRIEEEWKSGTTTSAINIPQ